MSITTRARRLRLAVLAAAGGAAVSLATAGTAAAQIPNPPADGTAPGSELVGTVLGWLKWA